MRKTTLVFLLPLLFMGGISGQTRREIRLDDKWIFSKTPEGDGARQWEYVEVPHSWNAADGCTKDYYRGGGKYEYKINLEEIPADQRAYLFFEGVSQEADVKVNGKEAGGHKGAFTAFCLEVTDLLQKGGNRIEVDVTNAPNPDIAPLEGDFTVFGGIYRPVYLKWLPATSISALDHASSGTYITPVSVSEREARIKILTKLDGEGLKGKNKYSLKTTILNPQGVEVASNTKSVGNNKENKAEILQEFRISKPQLWSKDSPALYTVRYELLDGKTPVDFMEEKTGFRYFHIDPEEGFYLNGASYPLRGVNRHQDRPGKGWAISDQDHDEDLAMIKEIGANTIRLAHYPHSPYFYDLCDENGMLVWAEIPFVGKGTLSEGFKENIRQQLVELIRQNYNRPSIYCWSLFNEIGADDLTPIVEMLNATAHEEDPSRFTVAATNHDNKPFNDVPDYLAYNTYPGWYWAEPNSMGPTIDWKKKGKGVGVSEYGAGASVRCHDSEISKAPKTDGPYHPEEWLSTVHEGNYREIMKRPFVWSSYVWNMFDFASGGRNEGDAKGMNDKGLVTYDRKTPKDAFYFYKANWSDDPVLHIASKRYKIRDKAEVPVKVYTNCKDVSLEVDGRKYEPAAINDGVAEWNNVVLKLGVNNLKVTGTHGGEKITDTCEWILKD